MDGSGVFTRNDLVVDDLDEIGYPLGGICFLCRSYYFVLRMMG